MENLGRVDPTSGLSTRLLDFLKTLNEALDWALANDVHMVLIAGDIFKNRDPSPTVQREFARCIRKLSAAGMPVFILTGNHDVPNSQARANTVEIYRTLAVPGVTIAQSPSTHVIETQAGNVQVVAVPWLSRSYLSSRPEFSKLSAEELNRELQLLVETFIDKAASDLDPSMPAILTAHASIQGAVTSSEVDITLGHEVTYPKALVMNPRFDYVAMGHIHKFQVLTHQRPYIIYPGSLERIDFGEEKDKKGFVTVEIDDPGADGIRQVRYEFHEVAARRFVSIKVSAECDSPTEEVLRRIEERGPEIAGSIVRMTIETTPEHQRELRLDEVRHALNSKKPSFVANLNVDSPRQNRLRLGDSVIEQMSPRKALEIYLLSCDTAPERVGTLLEHYDRLNATLVEK
ncbi:MAG: exonuclease SbcCD subunit D [Chloroflexota bacterium]|nr:exonuclease SbcCD subunit D [Chloroflexota bacterium]